MTSLSIFDINLGIGFTCKARFFADGNKVDTPPLMTYSSVVSRDSVWIVLKLAALNDLDINCTVIKNTYLNAKSRKRVWF